MQTGKRHDPVMSVEAVEGLRVRAGGAYVDCTLGDGGHTTEILAASAPTGRVLALDADPEALAASEDRLAPFGSRVRMVRSNFARVACVVRAEGFAPAHGVLFDLGLSSRQLDSEERGFSFQRPGPLDMRFAPDEEQTAADLVNRLSEQELANLLWTYGEEPRSRRIARGIVAARPITDAARLAEVVRRSSGYGRGRTHPATRTFQALRIAVNGELAALEAGLHGAADILAHNGRLVTIAYHSLEDRMVKKFVRSDERLEAVNRKVVKPSAEETHRNRRSRSARMRVAEKVGAHDPATEARRQTDGR